MRVFVILAFLQLNFQVVIWDLLGVQSQGINSNPSTVGWVVVSIALWLVGLKRWLERRTHPRLEILSVAWLVLILFHTFFYLVNDGPTQGILAFLAWGAWFPLLLWGANQTTIRLAPLIGGLFVAAGLINAIPALYEYFTGVTLFRTVTAGSGIQRLYGINQSVAWLGLQLGLGLIATLWFIRRTRRPGKRALLVVVGIIELLALLLTGGRGPLLFTIIGFGLMVVTSSKRRRIRNLAYIAILVPLVLIFVTTDVTPGSRTEFTLTAVSLEDAGNSARGRIYRETIDRILENPSNLVLGHGAGSGSVIPRSLGTRELNSESSFLTLLYEMGILGAIIFSSIWLLVIRLGIQGLRSPNRLLYSAFLSLLVVFSLEALIAEPMKGWVLMFYFWGTAAVLAQQRRLDRGAQVRQPIRV